MNLELINRIQMNHQAARGVVAFFSNRESAELRLEQEIHRIVDEEVARKLPFAEEDLRQLYCLLRGRCLEEQLAWENSLGEGAVSKVALVTEALAETRDQPNIAVMMDEGCPNFHAEEEAA